MADAAGLILPHDTVWAIYEPAARQLSQMLSAMDMPAHLREYASQADSEAETYFHAFSSASAAKSEPDAKPFAMDGSVAILTLSGALTKSGTSLNRSSSMVYIGRMVDLAARDKDVSAIMLRVDSPGGSVSGTQALAGRVAAAANLKPVIAVVEDLCASAAYWVASGATRILANPTAQIGSIGTYMAVADYSRAAANAGIAVHVLSTGPHKGAGTPGTAITPEQLAAWQSMVDGLNQHFLDAVSANRQIAMESVAKIADGRVHLAADALAMGLIDGIGTYDSALAYLQSQENNMKFLERLRAAYGTEKPSAETTEAAEAIATAADTELATQATTHAAALAAKEKEAADALAAKDAEISRLKAASQSDAEAAAKAEEDRAAAEAAAFEEENQAAVADLVASFKLTPAVADQAADLRAAAPEAFDGLFAAIAPLTDLAGTGSAKRPARRAGEKSTADAAEIAQALQGASQADQLTQIADVKIAESKGRMPFHEAFSAACSENPELAASYYAASSTRRS